MMKKIVMAVIVAATVMVSCKEDKKDKVEVKKEVKVEKTAEVVNNVDVENSVIHWKGTKPTGAHLGTVKLKSGALKVENGKLQSGEFVIDMNSIVDTDIPADNEYNAKLVGHLKSKDFFDVAEYPTAQFVITKVEEKDGKLAVTGNLRIKDVTKSITIPATISVVDGVVIFKSEPFKVDRADFGIKYKSKKFFDNLKDKFIDDLMEFTFEVKAKK